MLTAGSALDLPLCYLWYLWCPVQKRLPWEGEIFKELHRDEEDNEEDSTGH